mgnify:CR=1 FL=1
MSPRKIVFIFFESLGGDYEVELRCAQSVFIVEFIAASDRKKPYIGTVQLIEVQ